MNAAPPRQRGLSKFEFAIVATILGILATVLLDRLGELERQAERLEVELALRNLRMGLRLAISEKVIRGEEAQIGALLETLPLAWLGVEATKLGGDGTAPRWRYDTSTHTLSYRPRQPDAFGGHKELHWRIEGVTDAAGRITGITIVETLK